MCGCISNSVQQHAYHDMRTDTRISDILTDSHAFHTLPCRAAACTCYASLSSPPHLEHSRCTLCKRCSQRYRCTYRTRLCIGSLSCVNTSCGESGRGVGEIFVFGGHEGERGEEEGGYILVHQHRCVRHIWTHPHCGISHIEVVQ